MRGLVAIVDAKKKKKYSTQHTDRNKDTARDRFRQETQRGSWKSNFLGRMAN